MGLKEQLQKDRGKMSAVPLHTYNDEEQLESSNSEFWGIERSATRRAVMLDLRLKGGEFVSLPYSYMTKIKFNPSESLELFISGNHVKITGRNLHEVYNQLCRHRVTFIQASISNFDNIDEGQAYIKDIDIKEDI
ncbi:hypothetical protein LX87_05613 [Larkinella arboricola]|uniref:Uncharacterized protein n=1 Tax=Larkinella arboricola TaxID=643671 RepID=A0A327WIW2_LARAB|nr:hypothetical protein [Larkinella arboricola]RAJ89924.1 hypothetical protein LX87_05613 [Larkinella arboricola]